MLHPIGERGDRPLVADVKLRKLVLEMHDLGRIVDDDVRVVRMTGRVILVIGLGLVETLQRRDLRNDPS